MGINGVLNAVTADIINRASYKQYSDGELCIMEYVARTCLSDGVEDTLRDMVEYLDGNASGETEAENYLGLCWAVDIIRGDEYNAIYYDRNYIDSLESAISTALENGEDMDDIVRQVANGARATNDASKDHWVCSRAYDSYFVARYDVTITARRYVDKKRLLQQLIKGIRGRV